MELKSLLELMEAFSNSDIHSLKLEQEAFKIKLEKEPVTKEVIVAEQRPVTQPIPSQVQVQPQIQSTGSKVEEKEATQVDEQVHIVKSPIVGTFYGSPSPEASAYVTVGSKVKKGQILCIIEAMKLMNEIESEYDGEVVEVLVQNEQMVEYGQPLFKIK